MIKNILGMNPLMAAQEDLSDITEDVNAEKVERAMEVYRKIPAIEN